MKIEKINDYQIRCTLTKNDLAGRGIKLSELAYGTKRARELFKEMMEQAADNFGFTTDDLPIMVEAIPFNSHCIVLVITKCEDPEEMDTRFATFAPSVFYENSSDDDEDDDDDDDDSDEDYSDLFSRIQEGGMSSLFDSEQPSAKKVKTKTGSKQQKFQDNATYRIYAFPLLMDVIHVAHRLTPDDTVRNTLYRNQDNGYYMLLLRRTADEDAAFSNLCLLLTEYATEVATGLVSEQYLEEHDAVLIRDNALQTLRTQT